RAIQVAFDARKQARGEMRRRTHGAVSGSRSHLLELTRSLSCLRHVPECQAHAHAQLERGQALEAVAPRKATQATIEEVERGPRVPAVQRERGLPHLREGLVSHLLEERRRLVPAALAPAQLGE